MQSHSQPQFNVNHASLSDRQLELVLKSFGSAKQMVRVISGIHSNPGMLTHTISGELYCNNVSDIRQKSGPRLLKHGLKLVCTPQKRNNPLTNSYHWYLCLIGEIEYFNTDKDAANDEVIS